MAFAAGQNSRLLDMQRKFQQKHLTESKKNTIQSPSISIKEKIQIKVPEKHVTVSHENLKTDFSVKGKVRELFAQRRQGVRSHNGKDRSYPLKPLEKKIYLESDDQSIISLFGKLPNLGGGLLSESFAASRKMKTAQSAPELKSLLYTSENKDNSSNLQVTAIKTTSKILPPTIRGAENKPVLGAQNGKKDCDIYTKSVGEKKIVNKKSPLQKLMVKPTEQTKLPSLNNNKRNIKVSTIKTEVKSPPKPPPRANKETPKIITSIKPLANRPIVPGMERCPYCSRDFNSERIEKHKTVCLQTQKKKRKVFDMTKQRLEGTDAKEFINSAKSKAPVPKKKNNWRQKHEEFVANIRNARMAQQHLAKGGNLADLPPPPPLDTSDLIPCPHCGRKFNDNAATRHIPLCLERQKKKPIVKQSVKRF